MNWLKDERMVAPIKMWKRVVHEVIFEADTPIGKSFDILLIISILASVIIVMLDSVASIHVNHEGLLYVLEWIFTLLFTAEYICRLACVGRPLKYASSFFGIVDLLAIIPTYISLFLPGTQYLLVVRLLRILRIFRILKLVAYLGAAQMLLQALKASGRKIAVFLFTVLTLVVIFGSIMYLVEGPENGFTSIPKAIYWGITTMTTVGYGDISPHTTLGQIIASVVMVFGYGIIAVPTGIVTVEMSRSFNREVSTQSCPECSAENHDIDARHCKYCGSAL